METERQIKRGRSQRLTQEYRKRIKDRRQREKDTVSDGEKKDIYRHRETATQA